jgi:poly(hydroxyalkanoate) depolymerase family esterase
MFKYVPQKLDPSRPLVVALHGCAQQARTYDDETGWIKFADKYRFALLFPQSQTLPVKCFKWSDPGHAVRDQGEALSIKQMIDRMKADHRIDPKHIYITGLSAGGAMSAVMLSVYPELFAGGAMLAGIPYRCAGSWFEAQRKCGLFGKLAPEKDLTAAQWGDLVRQAGSRSATHPRISIWHGNSDSMVDPGNAIELMEQWTNVTGIDQVFDTHEMVKGHSRKVYKDRHGNALVETYLINALGHAAPIDPGSADDQCGKPARFIAAAGICSSYYIAKFWGLDRL